MARTSVLDKKILLKIAIKRDCPGDLSRIRKYISGRASRLKVSPPVALILVAEECGVGATTYRNKLSDSDKSELSRRLASAGQSVVNHKSLSGRGGKRNAKKIIKLIDYETTEYLRRGHIEELNKAYTYGCYTSVFILSRKIVENLMIDILKAKYPENVGENKEIYFDTNRGRAKDFAFILEEFKKRKNDFGSERVAVERLYNLAKKLKDDANNKTHSWYHLVPSKGEIDNLNVGLIIGLIKELEKTVGTRE